MEGIKDMIAAERTELAEVLGKLPAERWDDPTLCAGWRVREVVAHISMPFRYSGRRFGFELARSRGRFNAMADRCARRDAAVMSPDELVTALRSNASHPWKPPGGGYQGALTHDVIHGLDITEALGLGGSCRMTGFASSCRTWPRQDPSASSASISPGWNCGLPTPAGPSARGLRLPGPLRTSPCSSAAASSRQVAWREFRSAERGPH